MLPTTRLPENLPTPANGSDRTVGIFPEFFYVLT
jgi:hypothetical protein